MPHIVWFYSDGVLFCFSVESTHNGGWCSCDSQRRGKVRGFVACVAAPLMDKRSITVMVTDELSVCMQLISMIQVTLAHISPLTSNPDRESFYFPFPSFLIHFSD
ncbi:hypothetical protein XENOCAPTIV_021737 [Xenoophorus captivus]|uniref:Uncharacterized protein n=1 Tax=Xenoophorus captivus TaxID=1517983 RepID=A0ABV0QKM9_9TELE